MNEMLTCAACGRTAWDVSSRGVELEPPYRMVHDPNSRKPVPERFVTEPRCDDRKACEARRAAAVSS